MTERLYHYTTVAALIGILQERKIWLSDFRYLNDKEEMTFAKRLIKNAANRIDIEQYATKLSQSDFEADVVAAFRQRYREFLVGQMGMAFLPPGGFLTTIFSVSEESDFGSMASLWQPRNMY